MKKQRISSPHVQEPPPQTWSNCLKIDQTIYVAGMVPDIKDGEPEGGASMYRQAKAVFAKVRHLIEAAGAKMDDVVKINVFVTDIRRREEVWRARREVFSGDFPVSTLVEIRALAHPLVLVEIEAVAVIGAGG